jgi:hypothetical protein
MVRVFGSQSIRRAGGGAQALAFAAPGWHPQALLAPQPLDGLAVHPPALATELDVSAPIAPARMGPAEGTKLLAQRPIPVWRQGPMALGGAVLPDQPARPSLGDPEHPLEMLDGAAGTGRVHQFPGPSSFQGLDLELLVRHDPLQPGVLGLEFLQPLDVVGLQPAVLSRPAVVGGLRDLELLGDLRDFLALGQQPVSLPELADDLLGGVASSLHGVLLPVGAVGLSLVHIPARDLNRRGSCCPVLSGDGQGLVPLDGQYEFAPPPAGRGPVTAFRETPQRGPNSEHAARASTPASHTHAVRRGGCRMQVGWDWASETHDVTVMDNTGQVVDHWSLSPTVVVWCVVAGSERAERWLDGGDAKSTSRG